jgi:hypothetical protein
MTATFSQVAKQERAGCLIALGVFGLAGLALLGVISLGIGISQQVEYDHTYLVKSDYPGRDCKPGQVTFSVTDGSVLSCSLKGVVQMGPVDADFPGFTKAQDQAVTALAKKLGEDRLYDEELAQVQERIDQITGTLPPESRPNYHHGLRIGSLWGKSLAWAGGAVVFVIAVIGFFLRLRQVRTRP